MNGNGISTELSRVIVNGPGSVTRVTVTNLTEAGNYQCTVSNTRTGTINGITAVPSTSSLNISGLKSIIVIIICNYNFSI